MSEELTPGEILHPKSIADLEQMINKEEIEGKIWLRPDGSVIRDTPEVIRIFELEKECAKWKALAGELKVKLKKSHVHEHPKGRCDICETIYKARGAGL